MRFLLIASVFLLTSCARVVVNTSDMTPAELLQRSTHVFIGVIELHRFISPLELQVTGENTAGWRVVGMRVRVELVAQGTEPRPVLWIYEAFPGGGVSGDWNSTQDHRRYLFPVRLENGRYRVTRDFRRSIYPVYSGRHERLPLDETRPLWERFALLQWWLRSDYAPAFGYTNYADPGQVFGVWRTAKVLRGLLRHPDKHVRLIACEDLLHLSRAQDECWAALTQEDQNSLSRIWNMVPAHDSWQQSRSFETRAHRRWEEIAGRSPLTTGDVDELRLFTTINNVALRQQFCRKFQERFPGDAENGCPADSPPPATIVTENGDVPLAGAWPEQ